MLQRASVAAKELWLGRLVTFQIVPIATHIYAKGIPVIVFPPQIGPYKKWHPLCLLLITIHLPLFWISPSYLVILEYVWKGQVHRLHALQLSPF